MKRLAFIREAQGTGLSQAEIRSLLALCDAGTPRAPRSRHCQPGPDFAGHTDFGGCLVSE
ncbi:MerR family DNA-binding protein [Streptomyces cupreus]|uniref:MerR family DNA-binding protein n=1 Tax=Streptomyces cupreus TaxID=2759956 RepID=UPI001C9187CE